MEVGLFGGSLTRRMLAMPWCSLVALDKAGRRGVLMPSFEHPFDKVLIPLSDEWPLARRWRALRAVKVSDIEAHLPRPSYTLNSLEALEKRHPDIRFRLVAGSDILDQVDAWHKWDDIAARFDPILVSRSGYRRVPGTPVFPEVSSTEIRETLKRGGSVEKMVPAAVLEAVMTDFGSKQ